LLSAIQICCLTGSVGRAAFVLFLSSFELYPYISIFLEPLILEVELSELKGSSLIFAVYVGWAAGSELGNYRTV
jgi:hypothetical protein